VTRRVAAAGYAALAPELFAHDGETPAPLQRDRLAELRGLFDDLPPGQAMDEAAREAALAKRPPELAQRIRESFQSMMTSVRSGLDRYLPAVQAAIRHLREVDLTRGAGVATVGFCMGGGVSALAACHDPALRGAAIFYGIAPSPDLLAGIQCPVVGFYGSKDARLVDALPAFTAAMGAQGKSLETHVYEGVGHAFFNDERPSYDVAASRHAFARLLAFLDQVLKN